MKYSKKKNAHVLHFPEAALSGYGGVDFPSFNGFQWDLLEKLTLKILNLAGKLRLWLILGSSHRLTGEHKPHNSLYIINDEGLIVDRYDKRFCAGDASGHTGDLAHYTPGNHISVFDINGVKCGVLICHEYRYPELYREYKLKGVQLMFHSYHAGNISNERFRDMLEHVGYENHRFNPETTIPGITQPAAMHTAAANNYMWISCPNSSARESCWPSFFIRPDGIMTGKLKKHRAGILISIVDTERQFYDSTASWRKNAMNGIFHSGTIVQDERSQERKKL
jgi:predicted amidohydrolase